MTMDLTLPGEHRASNGVFYRVVGEGPPLLLLHGLMATGVMFDPLIPLLQDRFRMIIPDLRGHGRSGHLPGPYDVAGLTADVPAVLIEAGVGPCAVLGYSHGGAVAQQLAHIEADRVSRLLLACTYACNVATPREKVEAKVLLALLTVMSTKTLVGLIARPSKPKAGGSTGLTKAQAAWLQQLMGVNQAQAMRGAVRGLATFDSRPWLDEIRAPTLVVGGTHDSGVPRHHYDMLVGGIPGARGVLIEGAGHTLLWTHTKQFADVVRNQWGPASTPRPTSKV